MRFTVNMYEEDSGFWGEVPALPGCCSQGDTLEEMIYNIKEAIIATLSVSIQKENDLRPGLPGKHNEIGGNQGV